MFSALLELFWSGKDFYDGLWYLTLLLKVRVHLLTRRSLGV